MIYKKRMNPKLILFDFDGTMVDSLKLGLDVYNKIARKIGAGEVTMEQMRNMGGGNIINFMKEHKINWWRMFVIPVYVRPNMNKRREELKLFDGIEELIKKLHKKGYRLGVLTTNSKRNVRNILKQFGLSKYFELVVSQKMFFMKHVSIRRILEKYNLERSEMIYIGDEIRDIQACKKAGIDIISVTWGYNDKKILEKENPDYLFDSVQELERVLVNL